MVKTKSLSRVIVLKKLTMKLAKEFVRKNSFLENDNEIANLRICHVSGKRKRHNQLSRRDYDLIAENLGGREDTTVRITREMMLYLSGKLKISENDLNTFHIIVSEESIKAVGDVNDWGDVELPQQINVGEVNVQPIVSQQQQRSQPPPLQRITIQIPSQQQVRPPPPLPQPPLQLSQPVPLLPQIVQQRRNVIIPSLLAGFNPPTQPQPQPQQHQHQQQQQKIVQILRNAGYEDMSLCRGREMEPQRRFNYYLLPYNPNEFKVLESWERLLESTKKKKHNITLIEAMFKTMKQLLTIYKIPFSHIANQGEIPFCHSKEFTSGLMQKVKKLLNKDVTKERMVIMEGFKVVLLGSEYFCVKNKCLKSYSNTDTHRNIVVLMKIGTKYRIVFGCTCASFERRFPLCYHGASSLCSAEECRLDDIDFSSRTRTVLDYFDAKY